jgi:hypothetical protein
MAKKQFVRTSGKDWALTDNPAEAAPFTSAKSAARAKKKLEPHTKYFFSVERDEATGTFLLVALSKG